MKDLFSRLGSCGLIHVLIIAVICSFPVLFVWSINSLAEAGGADFEIKHSMWNYFVAIVFLILVRGGKG